MGRTSWARAALAMRLPIFSSCCQLEYLAQALKRHLTAARRASGAGAPFFLTDASARLDPCPPRLSRAGAPAPHFAKVQPESRVQTRLVGQRWKRRLSLRALARSRTLRARFSEDASLTISSTRSCRARWRMISAYTQGMGSNLTGQSSRY